jgi:hypothetical protein
MQIVKEVRQHRPIKPDPISTMIEPQTEAGLQ